MIDKKDGYPDWDERGHIVPVYLSGHNTVENLFSQERQNGRIWWHDDFEVPVREALDGLSGSPGKTPNLCFNPVKDILILDWTVHLYYKKYEKFQLRPDQYQGHAEIHGALSLGSPYFDWDSKIVNNTRPSTVMFRKMHS